jgi:hypothetical protein
MTVTLTRESRQDAKTPEEGMGRERSLCGRLEALGCGRTPSTRLPTGSIEPPRGRPAEDFGSGGPSRRSVGDETSVIDLRKGSIAYETVFMGRSTGLIGQPTPFVARRTPSIARRTPPAERPTPRPCGGRGSVSCERGSISCGSGPIANEGGFIDDREGPVSRALGAICDATRLLRQPAPSMSDKTLSLR